MHTLVNRDMQRDAHIPNQKHACTLSVMPGVPRAGSMVASSSCASSVAVLGHAMSSSVPVCVAHSPSSTRVHLFHSRSTALCVSASPTVLAASA